MRRWLARAGLFTGATLLALGLGEGLVRHHLARDKDKAHSDHEWRQRTTRLNTTLYRRSVHPGLVYEPTPGASLDMPYGVARFNQQQARGGADYPLQKGALPRVVLLGDSLVFSEMVSEEESLHTAAVGALQGRAEVLSFGVSGYDAGQVATWYEVAARPFAPDVVVVVYCLNDVMIMSGPYNHHATEEEAARKKAQDQLLDDLGRVRAETVGWLAFQAQERARFKLPAFVRAQTSERIYAHRPDYTDEYLLLYASEAHLDAVASALSRLGRAIRDDGAEPVLLVSPLLRDWERYRWHHVHDWVDSTATEAGFTVLDPLHHWQQHHDPADLRLHGDALHYDGFGNQLLAGYLSHALPL